MRTHRLSALTLCLAGLLVPGGCQQNQLRPVDLGPQLDADGQRRSVVLDTPLLNHIESRQTESLALPWYATRNDLSPAANGGYRQPTVQSSVTVTQDRQYSSHGQVHDQFYSTTYRREYRESVR